MLLVVFTQFLNAQVLRNILENSSSDSNWISRDELPLEESEGDDSYEDIICRSQNAFPKRIAEKRYRSLAECKMRLNRIEEASYIDLTYRIRWDSDRLDLFLPNGGREIFICDGPKLTKYKHDQRKDPDWWMISRNSPEINSCPNDDITIEPLDYRRD